MGKITAEDAGVLLRGNTEGAKNSPPRLRIADGAFERRTVFAF